MAKSLATWIDVHYNDPAPSDDGSSWGHLIDEWERNGSSELHLASIVAATTIWTADKSVNALVVDEFIEQGHRVHARDNEGFTPLLFVFSMVNAWMDSRRCGHQINRATASTRLSILSNLLHDA